MTGNWESHSASQGELSPGHNHERRDPGSAAQAVTLGKSVPLSEVLLPIRGYGWHLHCGNAVRTPGIEPVLVTFLTAVLKLTAKAASGKKGLLGSRFEGPQSIMVEKTRQQKHGQLITLCPVREQRKMDAGT